MSNLSLSRLLVLICSWFASFASALPAQIDLSPRAKGHLGFESGALFPMQIAHILPLDAEGDGDVDLLLSREGGGMTLALNNGHGVFSAGISISVQFTSVRETAAGDLDGDGDLDLLAIPGSATDYGTTAAVPAVLLNDGAGGFTRIDAIGSPSEQLLGRAVRLDDLDSDGDLDAVIGLTNYGGLRIWENQGGAAFVEVSASVLPSQTYGWLQHLYVGDVTGDGASDIIYTMSMDELLFVNDGHGHFSDQSDLLPERLDHSSEAQHAVREGCRTYLPGFVRQDHAFIFSSPTLNLPMYRSDHIAVLDLEGDGRPDLVSIDLNGTVHAYRQGSQGQLIEVSDSVIPEHLRRARTSGDNPTAAIALADLDGDGDKDVVVGGVEGRGRTSFTVGVPPKLLINTGGRFVDGSRRPYPFRHESYQAAVVGDTDRDGDLDLIFAAGESGATSPGQGPESGQNQWFNDGNGNFTLGLGSIPPEMQSAAVGALALFDADGDGDKDLFAGRGYLWALPSDADTNLLALNDGNGVFTMAPSGSLPGLMEHTAAVATGDVDGDGDLDIVLGNNDGFGVGESNRLYLNDGAGRFVDGTLGRLPSGSDFTSAIALGDLDLDGDLDVVVGNGPWGPAGTPGVRVYVNDGGGVFTSRSMPSHPMVSAMTLGDEDGDGDLDILLGLATLENDGAGEFNLRAATRPCQADALRFADFDEDGRGELVCGSSGVRVGDQDVWGHGQRYSNYRAIAVGDLDQDGDADLVVGGGFDYTTTPLDVHYSPTVLFNRLRDLRAPHILRVGQPWTLELSATAPITLAGTFLSFSALRPKIDLPGLGALGIDGTQGFWLPWVFAPHSHTVAVPADPALVDREIAVQSLFWPVGGVPRLSSVVVERIRP